MRRYTVLAMKRTWLLIALWVVFVPLFFNALAQIASAHVPRPVKPPLPSPMPPVVQMAQDDPMYEYAGYFDGTTVHVADLSYKFGVRHELGHVVDERYLDAGERQRFARLQAEEYDGNTLIGHDGTEADPWFSWAEDPGSDVLTSSYGDLGEKFADAYAACRSGYVREPGHLWETAYGYEPAAKQHQAICKFIYKAMRDPGQPAHVEPGESIAWR